MQRPELGQKIKATGRLVRWERWNPAGGTTKKYWAPDDSGPVEGIFIGYRTLSNGHRQLLNSDEGYAYTPTEYIDAWLIVTDPRHRPVFVLPSEVDQWQETCASCGSWNGEHCEMDFPEHKHRNDPDRSCKCWEAA